MTLTGRGPFLSLAPICRKTPTSSAFGETQKALHRKGRYLIEIRAGGATGSYDLQWEMRKGL